MNIVDADVAIISSIGIDHTDWLGNDIESIAAEKAGVSCVAFSYCLRWNEPSSAIINRAQELGSPLLVLGHDFQSIESPMGLAWQWRGLNREGASKCYPDLPLTSLMLSNVCHRDTSHKFTTYRDER